MKLQQLAPKRQSEILARARAEETLQTEAPDAIWDLVAGQENLQEEDLGGCFDYGSASVSTCWWDQKLVVCFTAPYCGTEKLLDAPGHSVWYWVQGDELVLANDEHL